MATLSLLCRSGEMATPAHHRGPSCSSLWDTWRQWEVEHLLSAEVRSLELSTCLGNLPRVLRAEECPQVSAAGKTHSTWRCGPPGEPVPGRGMAILLLMPWSHREVWWERASRTLKRTSKEACREGMVGARVPLRGYLKVRSPFV